MASFYYPQVTGGNSYILNTAAGGVTVPIYSTTSQVFGVWNPSGSNKNLILQSLDIGITALGSPAVGSYALCYQNNVGNAVAANNPITAATRATPLNALVGGQNNSVAFCANSSLTLAATASLHITLGLSNMTVTASNGIISMHYDFWDSIAVAPGNYLGVGGVVAPGSTCNLSLRWYEQ
jgi:hypothetical protein